VTYQRPTPISEPDLYRQIHTYSFGAAADLATNGGYLIYCEEEMTLEAAHFCAENDPDNPITLTLKYVPGDGTALASGTHCATGTIGAVGNDVEAALTVNTSNNVIPAGYWIGYIPSGAATGLLGGYLTLRLSTLRK